MSGDSDAFPKSGMKETFHPADNFRAEPRPEHHIHRDSEPLSTKNQTSYGQYNESKDPGTWEQRRDPGTPFVQHPLPFSTAHRLLAITGVDQGTPDFQDQSLGQNAFNSERPLNVQPANPGGVSIDGRGDLPEGHPKMADKVVGKMQKVKLSSLPVLRVGSDIVGWV